MLCRNQPFQSLTETRNFNSHVIGMLHVSCRIMKRLTIRELLRFLVGFSNWSLTRKGPTFVLRFRGRPTTPRQLAMRRRKATFARGKTSQLPFQMSIQYPHETKQKEVVDKYRKKKEISPMSPMDKCDLSSNSSDSLFWDNYDVLSEKVHESPPPDSPDPFALSKETSPDTLAQGRVLLREMQALRAEMKAMTSPIPELLGRQSPVVKTPSVSSKTVLSIKDLSLISLEKDEDGVNGCQEGIDVVIKKTSEITPVTISEIRQHSSKDVTFRALNQKSVPEAPRSVQSHKLDINDPLWKSITENNRFPEAVMINHRLVYKDLFEWEINFCRDQSQFQHIRSRKDEEIRKRLEDKITWKLKDKPLVVDFSILERFTTHVISDLPL